PAVGSVGAGDLGQLAYGPLTHLGSDGIYALMAAPKRVPQSVTLTVVNCSSDCTCCSSWGLSHPVFAVCGVLTGLAVGVGVLGARGGSWGLIVCRVLLIIVDLCGG